MKVIQNLMSENAYGIKCPYVMNPTRIVVHNTANDAPAKNEIKYMISNDDEVSFHFAVDDVEVIQGIPLNRNAWHAGDGGSGIGNRQGIGIEICYSKSGGEKFINAEKNAAKFIAQLLKERNWGIDKVTKHQDYSGKYCPHRTLDMGWDRFLNMIKKEMNGSEQEVPTMPKPSTEKYGVGTRVCVQKLSRSADGTAGVVASHYEGTITKVYTGYDYPYLLDNGAGFVNDTIIDSYPHTPSGGTQTPTPPKPSPSKTKYGVGTRVCVQKLSRSADGSAGVVASHYEGTITKIYTGFDYPYLLDNGAGFVNDVIIDSDHHTPSGGTSAQAPSKPSTEKYGVGTRVCVQKLSRSADGSAGVVTSHYEGTITKIYTGFDYPYLLDNGAGFVNDVIIDSDPHTP